MAFGAGLLLAPLEAGACSCAGGGDLWKEFAHADAAIIGVYEGKQGRTTYRFRVEEDFKADLGPTVDVEAPEHGASCGIGLTVGGRTGLYLSNERGAWRSSLCMQRRPAEIRRAAAGLPRPNGSGRVRYVVGGSFGPARLQALDARGRTLAYGFGAGSTTALAVCPGAGRVVEMVSADGRSGWSLAVRDLASLRVLRQVPLPVGAYDYVSHVHCLDASARIVYAYSGTENGGRVLRIRANGARTIHRGPTSAAVFSGNSAFLTQRGRVVRLDLRTDRAAFVARVNQDRTDRIAASPSGRRLALVGDSSITLVDTRLRNATAGPPLGPNTFGAPLWIDESTFAFLPGGGDSSKASVYTVRLRRVGGFAGWNTSTAAVDGRRIVGVGWGQMQSARVPGGPTLIVRNFFSRATSAIATVASGPEIKVTGTLRCALG